MSYIIIGIFSFWFACLSKIPTHISKALNLKKRVIVGGKQAEVLYTIPLITCEKCLAFWLGLGYGLMTTSVLWALVYAGCTSCLSILISLATNKYLR